MKPIIMLVMVIWTISINAQNELRLILANQKMSNQQLTFDILAEVDKDATEGVFISHSDLYFFFNQPIGAELSAEIYPPSQNLNADRFPAGVQFTIASEYSSRMSMHIQDNRLMINIQGPEFEDQAALENSALEIEPGSGMYLLGSFAISGFGPNDGFPQLRWDRNRPQPLMSQVFEIDPIDLQVYPVDFNQLQLMEVNFDDDDLKFAEAEYTPYQQYTTGLADVNGRFVSDSSVDWEVYPNPTANQVTIERNSATGTVTLFIFDQRAVQLASTQISQQEQLYLKDYTKQAGYYQFVLVDSNGQKHSKTVYYQP